MHHSLLKLFATHYFRVQAIEQFDAQYYALRSTLKVHLVRFRTRLLSNSPKGYMEVAMGYSQQDYRSIGSSLLLDSVLLLLCGMMPSIWAEVSSFSTMAVLFYTLQLF
jgi:hypothetical protein